MEIRMDDLSAEACPSCGQRHKLGEFEPRAKVVFVASKRRRSNVLVALGEVGTVLEWSQWSQPLYYRVEFRDGQRENFDPCELKAAGAKRFFQLDDDGHIFYTVVAVDLDHAKTIMRHTGTLFGRDEVKFDDAKTLTWSELSDERVSRMRCHTESERGTIPLSDANMGEWFSSEW